MQGVDEFIEQLLIDKGVDDLDPEVRKELKEDMKQRLMDQINRDAIMQLSDEQVDELNQKLNDPEFNDDKMVEFMEASGVDLTQVALETMLRFRNFYLTPEE